MFKYLKPIVTSTNNNRMKGSQPNFILYNRSARLRVGLKLGVFDGPNTENISAQKVFICLHFQKFQYPGASRRRCSAEKSSRRDRVRLSQNVTATLIGCHSTEMIRAELNGALGQPRSRQAHTQPRLQCLRSALSSCFAAAGT